MFQKEVDDTTNFGMFSFILEIIHDIGDKSVECLYTASSGQSGP